MENIQNRKLREIMGNIRPNQRDKSGNVVQLFLETEDFERYIIDDSQIGDSIFEHINSRVILKGYVAGEFFDGREIICATGYRIVK